ncbi:MAG: hypothetical protein RLY20_790 [Verrucomicrobiota bacterium]
MRFSFNYERLKGLQICVLAAVLLVLPAPFLSAATVPAGFTETLIPGPGTGGAWSEAIGVTFSDAGRMFVWERPGRIWFKDPEDSGFTKLLDISEEVGSWDDHGCVGFALDPQFAVNGYIYLLYAVDRYYLLNYGTPNYNPNANLTFDATIGRLTRYTCVATNNFRSIDLASRWVMVGDSKTNGIPICSGTHGMGSIVFGQDGTLLISCGDGASPASVDLGGATGGSYAPQALTDGILRPKENVGMYRSQLVDCLNGKVLRLDPATGNGVPSNPFYDAANPKSPRSRVWALGLRNSFRMSRRPNTGSHDPNDANPGVLYMGEVGWDTWESLKVITGPRQNMGWPVFEGLTTTPAFAFGGGSPADFDIYNQDAPNPEYPGSGCSQYFSFRQLLKQDSLAAADQPPFNNPCKTSVKIPATIPQFLHRRPVLDWNHASAITRTPTYNGSGQATVANVGAVGSPVSGAQFQGNCAVGGTWYTANSFPTQYQNTYFLGDWGQGVIKNIVLTTNDQPVAVNDFASAAGSVVCMAPHPSDGSIYYISYNYGDAGTVRKVSYTGNRTPVAVAYADKNFGPGPLTVQFTGGSSSDPDGQTLTYSWNFGDGSAVSTAANPSHTFTPPNSSAAPYTVTLTVTDSGGLSASSSLLIVANDTPPNVTITSPTNGTLYSTVTNTSFNLTASVADAETSDAQLVYKWETILRHNNHFHVVGTTTNHVGTTTVEPIGCDGVNLYHYRVALTVTDPAGLATVSEIGLFPNCGTTDTPPTISDITNQTVALGVATPALPFVIGDAQVAAANLQLSATSSNLTLVPVNNIVFGGSGANRTVTVTPQPGISGTSLITVIVNDGPNSVSDSFLLTASGSNAPPTISGLTNQTTGESTPIANSFTVSDPNTPAGNLSVSAFAANQTLVPTANIVFGGSGSNRVVTVTPAPSQTGTTTITVVVNDGQLTASNSYSLTVIPLTAATKSFTNAAAITIPDSGPSPTYPSTINVSGLGGTITNVTVTLRNLTHTWASDADVLLVSPSGQAMVLMSDCGDGPANNVTLTLTDAAAQAMPSSGLTTGTYHPTDYVDSSPGGDTYPSPAPSSPYAANFAVFSGIGANGTWSLYVVDDGAGDSGSLAGGWSLTLTTVQPSGAQTPTITDIPDQNTPVSTATAALPFTISDPDTAVSNLVLSAGSSNPTLVPTNNIVFGGSGSNRTVTVTPAVGLSGTSTISVTVSDGTNSATDTFLLTVGTVTVTSRSFTNAAAITIPDSGAGTPYPSTINVSGMSGSISNVTLVLRGFTHTWASDTDVLLVSPSGAVMVPLSDCGDGPVNNVTLTLSDAAAASMTATPPATGTYKPTNRADTSPGGDAFPSPAPTGSYGSTFGTFSNTAPNGTWSLYVYDDGAGDSGSFATGWILNITTTAGSGGSSNTPPTVSAISNQTTTVNTATAAIPFTIGDAETAATSLLLSAFSSNTNLVPTNRIVFGGSGTSRTVTITPTSNQLGTATITLSVSDGSLSASNSFALTVNPAVLTITESNATRAYGLTNPVLAGSLAGLQAGDSITASFSSAAATNSPLGAYPITFTLSDPGNRLGNYTLVTNNGTLTVTNAILTITENSASRIYGATNPPLTGSVVGLLAGDNITATFGSAATSNSPVGNYPITFTLSDPGSRLSNYQVFTNNGTLAITNAPLTITEDSTNRPYGTTNPTLTGSILGLRAGDNITASFACAATTNSAVGPYPITFTLSDPSTRLGNYFLITNNGTLTVTSVPLVVTANNTNRAYGLSNPPMTGVLTGVQPGDNITASFSSPATTNSVVGNYPISATLADPGSRLGNYTVTTNNGTLSVSAAPLIATANSTNRPYGTPNPTFTGSLTGLRAGDVITTAYVCTADTNSPVGTYPITITLADPGSRLGNYSVTTNNGVLTVGGLQITVTASNATRAYGTANPPLTGSITGVQPGDNITATFVTAATTNSTVGIYPIGIVLNDPSSKLVNYTVVTNNGSLSVTNAILTVTENSASRVYGATNPPLTGSVVGLLAGDVITASFSSAATTNSPVGGYPITFTLSDPGTRLGNYLLVTNNGTLTVTALPLLVKANDTNKVYRTTLAFTGREFTILSGSLVNGNTLTNVSLGSAGTAKGAKIGTYPITASGAQGLGLTNYSIAYSNGILTVSQAALAITANSLTKAYGTSVALPGDAYTTSDMEPGDSVTNVSLNSAGTANTAGVGNYALVPTNALGVGLSNYSINYVNGSLIVTQAVLTATADNKTRAYGQPNPTFTVSYSGFVNGEDASVLDSAPTAAAGVTNTTAPGIYPITLAGGTDDNYALSLVSGTFTISWPGSIAISTVEFIDSSHVRLAGNGDPNVSYQIQASTDLQTWQTLGTATSDVAGAFEFTETLSGEPATRFYRIATP